MSVVLLCESVLVVPSELQRYLSGEFVASVAAHPTWPSGWHRESIKTSLLSVLGSAFPSEVGVLSDPQARESL